MANQNLGIMLLGCSTHCNGCICYISNCTRRTWSANRRANSPRQGSIQCLHHLITSCSLLLNNLPGLLSFNPHFSIWRKWFFHGLAPETLDGFDITLCIYSFHVSLILHRAYLSPKTSTEICGISIVCSNLLASDIFRSCTAAALLWSHEGHHQQGTSTELQSLSTLSLHQWQNV